MSDESGLARGLTSRRLPLKKEYGVPGASLKGPKLWLPDWTGSMSAWKATSTA